MSASACLVRFDLLRAKHGFFDRIRWPVPMLDTLRDGNLRAFCASRVLWLANFGTTYQKVFRPRAKDDNLQTGVRLGKLRRISKFPQLCGPAEKFFSKPKFSGLILSSPSSSTLGQAAPDIDGDAPPAMQTHMKLNPRHVLRLILVSSASSAVTVWKPTTTRD